MLLVEQALDGLPIESRQPQLRRTSRCEVLVEQALDLPFIEMASGVDRSGSREIRQDRLEVLYGPPIAE